MTHTEQLYRDGKLIFDKVFHFEHLAEGPNEMLGSFDLPVVNKGRHRGKSHMDYFIDEARTLLLARYGEDTK